VKKIAFLLICLLAACHTGDKKDPAKTEPSQPAKPETAKPPGQPAIAVKPGTRPGEVLE
jgi:hypothetical protein